VGTSATESSELKGVGLHNKEKINLKYNLILTEETDESKVYFYKVSTTDATITSVAYLAGVDTYNNIVLDGTSGDILVFECSKTGEPELIIGTNSLYECTLSEDESLTEDLDINSRNVIGDSDVNYDIIYDTSTEEGEYLYDEYTQDINLFVIGDDNTESIINQFNETSQGEAKIIDRLIGDKYKHYTIEYLFKAYTGSESETIGDSVVYTVNEAKQIAQEELTAIRDSLISGSLEETEVTDDSSVESEITDDEGV
jgi:hypothetical protein